MPEIQELDFKTIMREARRLVDADKSPKGVFETPEQMEATFQEAKRYARPSLEDTVAEARSFVQEAGISGTVVQKPLDWYSIRDWGVPVSNVLRNALVVQPTRLLEARGLWHSDVIGEDIPNETLSNLAKGLGNTEKAWATSWGDRFPDTYEETVFRALSKNPWELSLDALDFWATTLAGQVPLLASTMASTMGGKIVGELIGGLGGAAVALVAGQAGPQVAAPEEGVTVPTFAEIGSQVGGGVVGFLAGWATMASFEGGFFYKDTVLRGVDLDLARKYSQFHGPVSGLVEYVQQAGRLVGKKELVKQGVKRVVKPFAMRLAKELGIHLIEGLEEVVQGGIQRWLLAKAMEEHNARHPDQPPLVPPPITEGMGLEFAVGTIASAAFRSVQLGTNYTQFRLQQRELAKLKAKGEKLDAVTLAEIFVWGKRIEGELKGVVEKPPVVGMPSMAELEAAIGYKPEAKVEAEPELKVETKLPPRKKPAADGLPLTPIEGSKVEEEVLPEPEPFVPAPPIIQDEQAVLGAMSREEFVKVYREARPRIEEARKTGSTEMLTPTDLAISDAAIRIGKRTTTGELVFPNEGLVYGQLKRTVKVEPKVEPVVEGEVPTQWFYGTREGVGAEERKAHGGRWLSASREGAEFYAGEGGEVHSVSVALPKNLLQVESYFDLYAKLFKWSAGTIEDAETASAFGGFPDFLITELGGVGSEQELGFYGVMAEVDKLVIAELKKQGYAGALIEETVESPAGEAVLVNDPLTVEEPTARLEELEAKNTQAREKFIADAKPEGVSDATWFLAVEAASKPTKEGFPSLARVMKRILWVEKGIPSGITPQEAKIAATAARKTIRKAMPGAAGAVFGFLSEEERAEAARLEKRASVDRAGTRLPGEHEWAEAKLKEDQKAKKSRRLFPLPTSKFGVGKITRVATDAELTDHHRGLIALVKKLGSELTFVVDSNFVGLYEDGKLYIDINWAKQTLNRTFAHEVAHLLRLSNFRDIPTSLLDEQTADLIRWVRGPVGELYKEDRELLREEAIAELIANSLDNPQIAAWLNQQAPSFWQRILRELRRFVARLRNVVGVETKSLQPLIDEFITRAEQAETRQKEATKKGEFLSPGQKPATIFTGGFYIGEFGFVIDPTKNAISSTPGKDWGKKLPVLRVLSDEVLVIETRGSTDWAGKGERAYQPSRIERFRIVQKNLQNPTRLEIKAERISSSEKGESLSPARMPIPLSQVNAVSWFKQAAAMAGREVRRFVLLKDGTYLVQGTTQLEIETGHFAMISEHLGVSLNNVPGQDLERWHRVLESKVRTRGFISGDRALFWEQPNFSTLDAIISRFGIVEAKYITPVAEAEGYLSPAPKLDETVPGTDTAESREQEVSKLSSEAKQFLASKWDLNRNYLASVVAPRTKGQRACQLLARELGIELVFLENHRTGNAIAGTRVIVLPIHISSLPTLSVFLHHEVAHVLGADQFRGLPQELVDRARDSYMSRYREGNETLAQAKQRFINIFGEAAFENEAYAEIIGEVAANSPLSSLLRSTKPGLWKKIIQTLKRFVNKLLKTIHIQTAIWTGQDTVLYGWIRGEEVKPLLDFYVQKLEEATAGTKEWKQKRAGLIEKARRDEFLSPVPFVPGALSPAETDLVRFVGEDFDLLNTLQARLAKRAGETSFGDMDLRAQTEKGLTFLALQRLAEIAQKPPRALVEQALGIELPALPKPLTDMLEKEGGIKKVRTALNKEVHLLLGIVFGEKKKSVPVKEAFVQDRTGQTSTVDLKNEQIYQLILELNHLAIDSGAYKNLKVKPKVDPVNVRLLREGLKTRIDKGDIYPDQIVRVLDAYKITSISQQSRWERLTKKQFDTLVRIFSDDLGMFAREAALRRAYIDDPVTAALATRITEDDYRRKSFTSRLNDMRYVMMGFQRKTGLPFHQAYLRMIYEHNGLQLFLRDMHKGFREVAPTRMWVDPVISKKIERYLSSGEGELTEVELKMAQTLGRVLDDAKPTVQFLRTLNWIRAQLFGSETDKKSAAFKGAFPNKKIILDRAFKAYVHGGEKGLREFLDDLGIVTTQESASKFLEIPLEKTEAPEPGRMLGVITQGYTPLDHISKRLEIEADLLLPGVTALHSRPLNPTAFKHAVTDRTILQRVNTALTQLYMNEHVRPGLEEILRLHGIALEDGLYGDPKHIAKTTRTLETHLKEILNRPTERGPISDAAFTLYNLSASSIFLLPRLVVRNLFQNPAMFPVRKDVVQAMFRGVMSEEDYRHYGRQVAQIEAMKHQVISIGPSAHIPVLGHLVALANKLSLYAWSDDINRLMCYRAALMGTRIDMAGALTSEAQGQALANSRHFNELDPIQQAHALNVLLVDGAAEASRYVASEITKNVHFVYDRSQRAPAEQGTVGRLIGNLLTFPRSVAQRYARMMLRVFRLSSRPSERYDALKKIINLTVGMYLTGEIYRLVTGAWKNPYDPIEVVFGWTPGGLQLGMATESAALVRDIIIATYAWGRGDEDGRKKALSRATNGLTRCARTMIPFYRIVLGMIEAATNTKDWDKLGIRKMRAVVEKRYRVPRELYEADREFLDRAMHFFLSTRAGEKRPTGMEPDNIVELWFSGMAAVTRETLGED